MADRPHGEGDKLLGFTLVRTVELLPANLSFSSVNNLNVTIGPVEIHSPVALESLSTSNPGIGGSEFHTIQIALLLSSAGAKVRIECSGEVPTIPGSLVLNGPTRVPGLRVGAANSLLTLPSEDLGKCIVVSHHPHDGALAELKKRLGKNLLAVVNVGRYQFFSNRTSRKVNVWLPAFGSEWNCDNKRDRKSGKLQQGKLVGHVSSLHKSKGFHIALAGWIRFANRMPAGTTKFRVIGSSGLYGTEVSSNATVPISGQYGLAIAKKLQHTPIAAGNVKFLGLISGSLDSEIAGWDVAIQNPTGIAEADPIVIQDCFRNHVPVIAGTLFGMYDYMRFFPELVAHTGWGVSNKLGNYLSNASLQVEILDRIAHISDALQLRRKKVESLWIELIASAANQGKCSGLEVGKIEFPLRWRLIAGAMLESFFRFTAKIR